MTSVANLPDLSGKSRVFIAHPDNIVGKVCKRPMLITLVRFFLGYSFGILPDFSKMILATLLVTLVGKNDDRNRYTNTPTAAETEVATNCY